MGDLVKSNNEIVSHKTESVEVEPSFSKVLRIKASASNIDFKGIMNKVCQYVNIADVIDKVKKGAEYVVQIPVELQSGFDTGKYWVMENAKSGKMWPFLMELGEDGKNKIVTPLGIKKEEFLQGNPIADITSSYHNLFIQQQIGEIASLVEATLEVVQRIENGQMDDRIGLLEAGKQGVLLALSQKDESSRTLAIHNAINNINIAQNQIFKTFERRIAEFKPLPKTKFGRLLREIASNSSYLNKRDDEYGNIQDYYYLYLQATKMLAGAYVAVGDIENAKRVFDMGIERLKNLDYTNLKTIEYAHKGVEFEKIYEDATEYLIEEKTVFLKETKNYDCLSISLSGEDLLEVIGDGKKISGEET